MSSRTTRSKPASQSVPVRKRRLRLPKYKSFRMQKQVDPELIRKPLSTAPNLFVASCKVLTDNWKLFLGILAIYAVINMVLVGSLSNSTDLQDMKTVIDNAFTGNFGEITGGLALFAFLISSPIGSPGNVASMYQTLLLLIITLALIWSLRQAYAQNRVRIRDAFYKGMYPLVTFVLILLAIGLQLAPFVIGGILYNMLVGGGIAVHTIEIVLCALMFFFLGVLSLYMVLSSIFALYIVTLPDMTPMKALRSARELVQYRRYPVLRKLLFLPLALLVITAVVMVPIVVLVTPAATAIFFMLTVLGVAVIHSYMYGLYRELIA